MKPAAISRAAASAIAVCSAYLQHPDEAEEGTRLILTAANIAALFELPDEQPARTRSLVLQAAVLARVVVSRLREGGPRRPDHADLARDAVVAWEAALLELTRELGQP
jgi:hypothetical protein